MSNWVAVWYGREDVPIARISAEFGRLLVEGLRQPSRKRGR